VTTDPALAHIAEVAERNERKRELDEETVESLRATGIFEALVPADLGGGEIEPAELIATVDAISAADGSAGWCAGVGATAGLAAAYLPGDAATRLFGSPPGIAAGVFAPRGKLTAVGDDGRMALSGHWPLASGIKHADLAGFGCIHPDRGPLYAVVARDTVKVIETWDSLGLRATGSHDVEIAGIEVQASDVVDLVGGVPEAPGPLYRFPLFGLLALSVSAVCTGLARGALEDLKEAAPTRRPLGSTRSLADRGTAQAAVAEAEGALRAARAGVDAAVAHAWDAAEGGDDLEIGDRAALRLAATHAAQVSVRIVDTAHRLSGSGGLYAGTAERRLRDVHTAAQHMIVAPATLELAGRVLLGANADLTQL
jgi:indole-3-acetate monooxygenase